MNLEVKRKRDDRDEGDQDGLRDSGVNVSASPDGGQVPSVGGIGETAFASEGMAVDCICECPPYEDFPLLGKLSQDWSHEVPANSMDACGISYSDVMLFDDATLGNAPDGGHVPSVGESVHREVPDADFKLDLKDWVEYDVVDDLNGEWLSAELVTASKIDELKATYQRHVWTEVPIAQCLAVTGQKPISVRWVVHNKGDNENPNVRARLVARHIREKYGGKEVDDLFAAMPPFEAVKLILTKCVQSLGKGRTRKLMFIDVSKAHLYAPVDEDTEAYVDLPPECKKEGVCGRLNFWLYGMRPASRGWGNEYSRRLADQGFVR
jgi:hypothetical protein